MMAWMDLRAVIYPRVLDRRTFSFMSICYQQQALARLVGSPQQLIDQMNCKQTLQDKMIQVRLMEAEMKELAEKCNLIDSQKKLSGNLVDAEGFPRADLNFGDIAEYRTLKRRFNELNNDHAKLMKTLEIDLFQLHAGFKNDHSVQQQAQAYVETRIKEKGPIVVSPPMQKPVEQPKEEYKIEYLTPFAKITSVQEDSPAFKAGLATGDLISEIGQVNVYDIDGIKGIPRVVKEDLPLKVVVMRLAANDTSGSKVFNVRGQDRIRVEIVLTPKKWDGRGLMGCKIDPLY